MALLVRSGGRAAFLSGISLAIGGIRSFALLLALLLALVLAMFAHSPARAHQPEVPAAYTAALSTSELPIDIGGPFSLVDHSGRRWTDRDFRGKFMIVYFGYTSCPYTCSTAVLNIAGAMDALDEDAGLVRPLFITVDPVYDTPERLAAYVQRIHPKMLGLTGSATELDRVFTAYRVQAREVVERGGFERLFDHNPIAYLVGADGKAKTLLPPILPPARIAEIVRGYMHMNK